MVMLLVQGSHVCVRVWVCGWACVCVLKIPVCAAIFTHTKKSASSYQLQPYGLKVSPM